MTQFEEWLTMKLQELNTDETVFLPYIVGILEGDEETEEEKKEGIVGLLSDEAAIEETLNEIFVKWKESSESCQALVETVTEDVSKLDITRQMQLITQEKIATHRVNKTEKTEEEKKVKAAILSGYSGETEEDGENGDSDRGLVSNSNAEAVHKVCL